MNIKLGRYDYRAWSRVVDLRDRLGWPWFKAKALLAGGRCTALVHGWQTPGARRLEVWSGALAATAALGLLLAFHQVARAGVLRAELHYQTEAALAESTSQCRALRRTELVNTCLADSAVPADAGQAVSARPSVLPGLVALSDGAGT